MPASLVDSERLAPRHQNGLPGALRPPRRAIAALPQIRGLVPEDYLRVSAEVDQWSRGRFIGIALPRSFFQHFSRTSLIMLEGDQVAGVLIGFLSQETPSLAYIHFFAVAPQRRRRGYGQALFQAFMALVRGLGCTELQSIAPPVNSGLIAFHCRLGFEIAESDGFASGIAVCRDYAGPGQHRVLFRKRLGPN